MFCPHCHNKIPDGSNICPLCYSNLAGLKPQQTAAPKDPSQPEAPKKAPVRKSSKGGKKPAYTKGSRGGKKNADKTPMIIAFGLIVILVIIIAMIVRSMFTAGDNVVKPQNTTIPQAQTQVQVQAQTQVMQVATKAATLLMQMTQL